METIGERVKRLRTKAGLTQQELSERLGGGSLTVISRIEKGVTKDMRMPTAQKLAKALGATPEYILYGSDLAQMYPIDVANYILDPKNSGTIKAFVYTKLAEESQ